MNKRKVYSVSAINTGFTSLEPELMVTNSVARVGKRKRFPFLVCNNTNRTITLRRGNVVARVEEVSGEMTPVTGIEGCTLTDDEGSADCKANIPDKYRDAIVKLLEENKDLFAKNGLDLGRTNTVTCKIETGTHTPITLKPYRTPLNQRPVVEKAVDEMLEAGVIRPSTSNWSFPILLVPKPDGTKRFCVDFRKLNQITKRYAYSLPLTDGVLAGLGNSKFITSLDPKSGYWRVPMDEMDREKTSFVCHKGLFCFNLMPMGITNGPGFYQKLMTMSYKKSMENWLLHILMI